MLSGTCCRTLARPCDDKPLGTRELAQSIVFWLDEGQVPAPMCDLIYTIGMIEDLRQRNKTIANEDDEGLMKSRWVRQLLHQEIDAAREAAIDSAEETAVDLVISGALTTQEQESITMETEQAK